MCKNKEWNYNVISDQMEITSIPVARCYITIACLLTFVLTELQSDPSGTHRAE